MSLSRRRPLPDQTGDWQRCIAPNGKLYFKTRHAEKGITIVTSNDLLKPRVFKDVQARLRDILDSREMQDAEPDLFRGTDLVLDLHMTEAGARCGYYFASKQNRSIFWLHAVPVYDVAFCAGIPVLSEGHLGRWCSRLFGAQVYGRMADRYRNGSSILAGIPW